MFVVTVDDNANAADVANMIDAAFANSAYETSTYNEREFLLNRLRQIGDVQAFVRYILSAVFFALLFVIGNTIARSVRGRRRTFGVLKAIGFERHTLMLAIVIESMVITVGGALIGMTLAGMVLPAMFPTAPVNLTPNAGVWLFGGITALLLAILVSIWPMYNVYRSSVTQALTQVP